MNLSPAIRFLLIFAGSYFILNLGYGLYIESRSPEPDEVTYWISEQVVGITHFLGRNTNLKAHPVKPTVTLSENNNTIVNVYEGCNGLNVAIVFVSFLLAFGGKWTRMSWFLPTGLLLIHGVNLIRLLVLYFLSASQSRYFYYFHKYLFTAFIFLFVFLLWWVWIQMNKAPAAK